MAARPRRRTQAKPGPGLSAEERAGWKATYDRARYEELPWFSKDPTPWVVRAVREGWIPPGAKVLDVGCGAGTNVLWLASQGFQSYGVDIAPGAVTATKRRADRAGLRVIVKEGEATALPFGDAEFAAVLDSGCFHTLPLKLRTPYVRELSRVVQPGGDVLLIWVGREETRPMGPTHRPALVEVAEVFEPQFIFRTLEFNAPDSAGGWSTPAGALALYTVRMVRRTEPQPPFR